MQGVELAEDRKTKVPAAGEKRRLRDLTKENGLIIGKRGWKLVRIPPALTCSRRDGGDATQLLDRSSGRLQQSGLVASPGWRARPYAGTRE